MDLYTNKKISTWQSSENGSTPIDELTHEYLSNILWYLEIFGVVLYNPSSQYLELLAELEKRFDNKRLPYLPLPITDEISILYSMGLILGTDIINDEGKVIGSIRHIVL